MPRIATTPSSGSRGASAATSEHAALHGTPRPESQAIRAHVPAVLHAFSNSWDKLFRHGVLEHPVKELCRVYVSKTIECHY